jgi:hypothetical protein
MNETQYQRKLIKRIEKLIPGCSVIKNDPQYNQGIPDLLILYNDRWAMVEVKISADARAQPNQEYYVGVFDKMSFASFINPENEEDVLHDLQCALGFTRKARIS